MVLVRLADHDNTNHIIVVVVFPFVVCAFRVIA